MDFFHSQEVARRKTSILLFYFVLAVLGIVASVYVAIIAVMIFADVLSAPVWSPKLFGMVSAATLAVVACGSLYRMAALRSGGDAVATMLGGTLIDARTTSVSERRVLNVVEEMAIASGTPVPPVYLLEEPGINAFAAGYSPSDAIIGVTRGCTEQLSRDQLQGVMGHEFSHILNGDMRLNIRLMGVIFGILCLTVIGRILLRTRGRKNPLPLLGIALLIAGFIGVFFGKLIKSAISRQREFLADASSVQFTRNPSGLAGALKKIGGFHEGSRLEHPSAEEASHMYFANGLRLNLVDLMATHPPLKERIRRIDPSFDGEFSSVPASSPDSDAAEELGVSGFQSSPPPLPSRPPPLPPPLPLTHVITNIGNPQPQHVEYAAQLLATIPPPLTDAAHDPAGARALVYALLCATDATTRDAQLELVRAGSDSTALTELQRLLPATTALPPGARLPLIDVALAALRGMTADQHGAFMDTVTKLVEADGQIDLFEFMLQHVLARHLDPQFGRRPLDVRPISTMADVTDAAADLFATLAYYGHDEPAAASRAFDAGFARLQTGAYRQIRPLDGCGLDLLAETLQKLDTAVPPAKKRILEGCLAVIGADGRVALEEAELLRAVGAALGCPVPPLLPDAVVAA